MCDVVEMRSLVCLHQFAERWRRLTNYLGVAHTFAYGLLSPYECTFSRVRLMSMENQQKRRKPALQIASVLILVVILGIYILAQ
jgi:hypothetical protein